VVTIKENFVPFLLLLILVTSLYDIFKKKWIFRPINGGAMCVILYQISPDHWWTSLIVLVFFYVFEWWRHHRA